MLRYFPFAGAFDLKMGTLPMIDENTVVEIDEHYLKEICLKRQLLTDDHNYYYNSKLRDDIAAWDVVEKILTDLVKTDPTGFSLDFKGDRRQFRNMHLNEAFSFTPDDSNSLPLAPLDWIGRHVQEDLVILNPAGEVVAGQLCFPSGWSLGEKIGKQFMEVHAPLPTLTNPMIAAANKLIERLPANKPMTRNNWGFRIGDQLDLSSKHSSQYKQKLAREIPMLTSETIGDAAFLRVEHQTLTRLVRSGYILFTIHTYNSSLADEAKNPERKSAMLKYLESTPADLIAYKQMDLFYDLLISYLRK